MAFEFKLPDLGEGLHEGEVVAWKVKEGDAITADQPLVTILTDKAEVEIPSPKAGTVLKLLYKAGQKVQVGQVFIVLGEKGENADGAATKAPASAPAAAAANAPTGATVAPAAAPAADAAIPGAIQATPAVRKLAKDMGVVIEKVTGTGPSGRITEDDVKKAASTSGAPGAASAGAASASKPGGPEERVPYSGIRRRTGEKMSLSKNAIPHVTHIDEADVTELVKLREEMKPEAAKRGVKLTYLAFILKAVTKGLKEFPYFNASLDEEKSEIVLKKFYNLGIAIDTPQGLYSPTIRDTDKKTVWEVASDIEKLAAKARENKLDVTDLTGGSFTVTNIGPLGGTAATPIIVHPQCAILAVMKIRKLPVFRDNAVAVRDMMNFCLSFDHRLVDGAEAARFTNTVITAIENPRTLL